MRIRSWLSCGFILVTLGGASAIWADLTPFKPTPEALRESYQRGATLRAEQTRRIRQERLAVTWVGDGNFWYIKDLGAGVGDFMLVTSATGKQEPLFDREAMKAALDKELGNEKSLAERRFRVTKVGTLLDSVALEADGKTFSWSRKTGKLSTTVPAGLINPGAPDRGVRARVSEGKVQYRKAGDSDWTTLSTTDGFTRAVVSPDEKYVVGTRVFPGDRKETFVVQTNMPGTRGVLKTRQYDQPGDKLDTCTYVMYDVATGKATDFPYEPLVCGGYPWANPPGVQWWRPDGQTDWSFTVEAEIRGYQEYKVYRAWPAQGKWEVMIDETSKTFVDTGDQALRKLQKQDGAIWLSERDGWSHIYLVNGVTSDGNKTKVKQLTKGEWVVRDIVNVDEDREVITFTANGKEAGDPYFMHTYSVKLDGTGLKRLDEGNGTHSADWSPEKRYFVDTRSTVNDMPVYDLIDRDGKKIAEIARATDSQPNGPKLLEPKVFTSKGRDGKTDIWGIIHFPSDFDPERSYPVLENIYAGPHDSFVPKTFSPYQYSQDMAELGFIVVQIDGMGTDNRGKAFQDVCWKNLKDAGFPDRIAWMKAAAKVYPQMDLSRVGIYGTSAGGQESSAGVLFHPDFYKVAVSSCGCHDNRIDKYWWNEQWMGYPIGPQYSECSNIDNAKNLVGHLLLIVGEVDSNVPPETTYKFAQALMTAGKDFELVTIPGSDHTSGGPFGERKRRDFFVKWLLGVEPPDWNVGN